MSSQFRVVYTVPSNAATVKGKLRLSAAPTNASPSSIERIASYTNAISCGAYNGKLLVATTAVAATGTITFSSIANNDTVTINGRVYTAKTSGATGAQQFNIGGSDAQAALNLQAIVNADTNSAVYGVVVLSSGGSAVSTVTCLVPGNIGNQCTLAISAHGSVSGANLTGGSEDTNITLSVGV